MTALKTRLAPVVRHYRHVRKITTTSELINAETCNVIYSIVFRILDRMGGQLTGLEMVLPPGGFASNMIEVLNSLTTKYVTEIKISSKDRIFGPKFRLEAFLSRGFSHLRTLILPLDPTKFEASMKVIAKYCTKLEEFGVNSIERGCDAASLEAFRGLVQANRATIKRLYFPVNAEDISLLDQVVSEPLVSHAISCGDWSECSRVFMEQFVVPLSGARVSVRFRPLKFVSLWADVYCARRKQRDFEDIQVAALNGLCDIALGTRPSQDFINEFEEIKNASQIYLNRLPQFVLERVITWLRMDDVMDCSTPAAVWALEQGSFYANRLFVYDTRATFSPHTFPAAPIFRIFTH